MNLPQIKNYSIIAALILLTSACQSTDKDKSLEQETVYNVNKSFLFDAGSETFENSDIGTSDNSQISKCKKHCNITHLQS